MKALGRVLLAMGLALAGAAGLAVEPGPADIEAARAGLAGEGISDEQRAQAEAELASAAEHLAGAARVQAQISQLQDGIAALPAQAERLPRPRGRQRCRLAGLAGTPAGARRRATLEVLPEGERATMPPVCGYRTGCSDPPVPCPP